MDFPVGLVNSMRDGNLVVFAGAGVSMGEPSRLPDFEGLALEIAQGTGIERFSNEPVDRYLGRLLDEGVRVHERAASGLSGKEIESTLLHRELLRLFAEGRPPRVVTTNFDLLFEKASEKVFEGGCGVYRAPALPLGRKFEGIVHVHGDVSDPEGMVLTDKDFGEAYLTDGYARFFLVELFRAFDVLFVGYSHNDTVMSYLARALPREQTRSRFALTDDEKGVWWRFLGIEPVFYPNDDGDHASLRSGVSGLADNLRRGNLDWRQQISAVAAGNPMFLDDEESDLIVDSLSVAVRARFFTQAATDPAWMDWLQSRGLLDSLFQAEDLDPPIAELARWLALNFALRHSENVFGLILSRGMRMNPGLWRDLAYAVGSGSNSKTDPQVLSQWVSLLVDSASQTKLDDTHVAFLLRLSECCGEHGLTGSTLEIFGLLSKTRLGSERWRDSIEPSFGVDHYELNEVWEKALRPGLEEIAEPLLGLVVENFRRQFFNHRLWSEADSNWEPVSGDRSAIEPHEQDSSPGPNDVLIDVARDCLEHLAARAPVRAAHWSEFLIGSGAVLFRRLAVHILDQRQDLTADEKLDWLLANVDIHDEATHHEVFRVVGSIFAGTGQAARQRLVESVFSFRWPDEEDDERERRTAYRHFTWLSWLCDADPDCDVSKTALGRLREQQPSFRQRENPDFTFWSSSGTIVPTSPWTVDELVERPVGEWLERLLSFQGNEAFGPSRWGLLQEVQRAVVADPDWGLALASALESGGNWSSDLWPRLLESWTSELGEERHRRVLGWVGNPDLLAEHARAATDVLLAIVQGGGFSYASVLLELTNHIALSTREHFEQRTPFETSKDWVFQAINHPAGRLAEYWLQSLSIWRQQRESLPCTLGDAYRTALSAIVDDRDVTGRLGKAILCSRLSFLLGADHEWTIDSLLPTFDDFQREEDCQAAWHGFLRGGTLNPELSELMYEKFLGTLPRLDSILADHERRREFIGRFATMAVYFVEDPFEEWLPAFFRHASSSPDRQEFTRSIGILLRNMDDTRQRNVWDRVLRRYWEERLMGIPPPPPDAEEVGSILDWVPHFDSLFPEVVDLAIRTGDDELDKHLLVHRIGRGEFSSRYPGATARLVIHLGNLTSEKDRWMWHHYKDFLVELFERDLPEDVERSLREMMAKMGLEEEP